MLPNLVGKNQFGETSNFFIQGGSNQIDISFIVDSANGNGLGIRSLKGSPLVSSVYMHTSATPASGNPNPAPGFAIINFAESFQGYVSGYDGEVSPLSGTSINVTSGLTAGQAYVIASVGTTTQAEWQTLGLAPNVTPNVGAAFIAATSAAGTGTGVVETPSVSGVVKVEVVGDPNQTCNASVAGGQMIIQFLGSTSSSVTTLEPVAPANNTVVGLRFVMDSSLNAPLK